MVIRGIIHNGMIQPIGPLPVGCSNGDEVEVHIALDRKDQDREFAEKWLTDMQRSGAAQIAPEERAAMERVWRDADEQAKAQVQRQMESL